MDRDLGSRAFIHGSQWRVSRAYMPVLLRTLAADCLRMQAA